MDLRGVGNTAGCVVCEVVPVEGRGEAFLVFHIEAILAEIRMIVGSESKGFRSAKYRYEAKENRENTKRCG